MNSPVAIPAASAVAAAKPGVFTVQLPRATLDRLNGRFPGGVNVLVVPPTEMLPEFIRLPKGGEKCPVTGLPRTTLIDLLEDAGDKVRVCYLRKRGAASGIKLIPRQQLIDYIYSLPTPAEDEEEDE